MRDLNSLSELSRISYGTRRAFLMRSPQNSVRGITIPTCCMEGVLVSMRCTVNFQCEDNGCRRAFRMRWMVERTRKSSVSARSQALDPVGVGL